MMEQTMYGNTLTIVGTWALHGTSYCISNHIVVDMLVHELLPPVT